MKVYLSGPMTGKPDYNKPAFERVAKWLREGGNEVVSPIELDRADGYSTDDKLEDHYWEFLARDIRIIGEGKLDAMVLLRGWELSKGARLEVFQAMLLGIEIFEFVGDYLVRFSRKQILDALYNSLEVR